MNIKDKERTSSLFSKYKSYSKTDMEAFAKLWEPYFGHPIDKETLLDKLLNGDEFTDEFPKHKLQLRTNKGPF
jgi:hypothetical protein